MLAGVAPFEGRSTVLEPPLPEQRRRHFLEKSSSPVLISIPNLDAHLSSDEGESGNLSRKAGVVPARETISRSVVRAMDASSGRGDILLPGFGGDGHQVARVWEHTVRRFAVLRKRIPQRKEAPGQSGNARPHGGTGPCGGPSTGSFQCTRLRAGFPSFRQANRAGTRGSGWNRYVMSNECLAAAVKNAPGDSAPRWKPPMHGKWRAL